MEKKKLFNTHCGQGNIVIMATDLYTTTVGIWLGLYSSVLKVNALETFNHSKKEIHVLG